MGALVWNEWAEKTESYAPLDQDGHGQFLAVQLGVAGFYSINQLLEQYAGRSRIQGPHQVRRFVQGSAAAGLEFCDGFLTHSPFATRRVPGTFSSAALGRRGISPCLST